MYFRNKFDKEFLYLCNNQEEKGGTIRLNKNDGFWIMRKKGYNQPTTIEVIPLLLFNKLESTNSLDDNVEDYMMICKNKSDTMVTCTYDPNYTSMQEEEEYICSFGIENITGDLAGNE